ncbi:MAG TPA: NAD(P)H-binding protein [Anaerolineales bacterium]
MYVVTGATGNTGSQVVKQLLFHGEKVRVIGRDAGRLDWLVKMGAEPFVADLKDVTALTRAFTGAKAVYAMIPPSPASPDYRKEQGWISDCIATALAEAGVRYCVSLSSIGADKASGTGPIVGLHDFEQKLNAISGLNTMHVRAGYFMENTLAQADVIPQVGSCAGPLRSDLKLPMVCARDVGQIAGEELLDLDFHGQQIREVHGLRDYTYSDCAKIIGQAIGNPNLKYVQLPDNKLRPAMERMGMSSNFVDLILEMSAALNSGQIVPLEPRSVHNTTPTSFETFVIGEFLPVYQSADLQATA